MLKLGRDVCTGRVPHTDPDSAISPIRFLLLSFINGYFTGGGTSFLFLKQGLPEKALGLFSIMGYFQNEKIGHSYVVRIDYLVWSGVKSWLFI